MKLARGLCYKRRESIGPKGNYEVPPEVDYNLWCGPARMLPLTRPKFHYDWHWQREWGNGDMGNQGPHQMDIARWGLGVDRLADRVIAYGGRLGYEDAGDVANTEVGLFEFGDKTLVFEVRGLETDPLRGASVGVIFYGSEGYVVLTSYTAAAAFDPQGKLVKKFHGGGDHFGNFVDAVKARDPKLLHADVLEGHLSCAHSHLANISYYLGKPASVDEIKHALADWKTHEDVAETLERTLKHLAANDVDLAKTPLMLGPALTIDSGAGDDRRQRGRLGNAHPRISGPVRRAVGRGTSRATHQLCSVYTREHAKSLRSQYRFQHPAACPGADAPRNPPLATPRRSSSAESRQHIRDILWHERPPLSADRRDRVRFTTPGPAWNTGPACAD